MIEIRIPPTRQTPWVKMANNHYLQVVTVPDQLGAVAGALLQAVVAAGGGNLLAKQLEERFDPQIIASNLLYFPLLAIFCPNS